MTIGFRIHPRPDRVATPDLVERFRALPVANVSDSMNRMFAAGSRLRPMHGTGVLAGPAFTVRTRPGDNLMVHKALDMAHAGDVVVVDAGGDLTNAIIGELMIAHAERRGLAGIVIDGAIRDAAAIRAGRFPVFAAGVTHRGPYKDGPGDINAPIACGGMTVRPGDLMLGDDDGLVCVPLDDAEAIYNAAAAKHAAEGAQMAAIREGRNDRAWVDAELERRGVEMVA